jgi:hypothetical protein
MYLGELLGKFPTAEDDERIHDMNPDGFWEDGRFTVRGLRYSSFTRELIRQLNDSPTPYVGKIVSQGLARTDPVYVDRVVLMTRHPRAVAKSQEKLEHIKYKTPEGEVFDMNSEKIHTPQMFIKVSLQLADWFVAHPKIPCCIVDFDDLIDRPAEALWRVRGFIGEGDFRKAVGNIKPKLRRSYPENVANTLWGEAEQTYELLKQGRFSDIVEFFKDPKRNFNREVSGWVCPRIMGAVNEAHCRVCKADVSFRRTLRAFSEEHEIPWSERPCAFEVAHDLDNPLITIDESIKHNFWEEAHEFTRQHQSTGWRVRLKGLPRPIWSAGATRARRKHCREQRA